MVKKNKMAAVDLTHTFNIINYITKYYIFTSENNFTLKCNVKPNVLILLNYIVQIFICWQLYVFNH